MVVRTDYSCKHRGNINYTESFSLLVDGVTGQVIICNINNVSKVLGGRTDIKVMPNIEVSPTVFKNIIASCKHNGAGVFYNSNC